MKFSIRDLLWLTVVFALAISWWLDHRRQSATVEKLNGFVDVYEKQLISTRSSGFVVPSGRIIPGTTIVEGSGNK